MLHWQDIRYAFRLLARSPGFTLLTVLVLAGGLGLSTFTFSFLHTAMVRPLPLSEGDRIVRLFRMEEGRRRPVDVVDLAALRASIRAVGDLGGYTKREVILGRKGDRRVLMATITDPALFTVARTPALFGRTLLPPDARPGAEPVIVLSHRTWEVAFVGDRSMLDTHVTVNGVSTRVVGVMPEGFGFPVSQEAWLPLPVSLGTSTPAGREFLSFFGRLAPGVTHAQAASEATALLQRALAARDTSDQRATRTVMSVESFPAAQIAVLGNVVSVRATRTNVREVLQDGSARAGSRHEGRLARTLVVTQVTTVTVLMFIGVLAGVMTHRMVNMDPGYDPTNLLQAALEPSVERFPTEDARTAIFRSVQARLAEHGALEGALLRTKLAERGDDRGTFALRESQPSGALPAANILATLGAMSTLGIDLVEGRLLEASDDRTRTPVVLISRSLATRQWRGRSPIGDQLRLAGLDDTLQWRTIVGVVSDIPYGNPRARDRSPDAIYVPLLQAGVPEADVIVRYRTNEVAGRQALREVFGAVDPLLVPGYVYRSAEVIRKAGLVAVGMTKLFGSCLAFALLLAVAGTYGLMSRSIGLRTREIGVRRALGASDAIATRMLLTQGARQLGIGTLVAAPILAIVGAASTHFFPLSGVLTATLGTLVSVSILAVVLAATWLPTRKVLRVPLRDALWRE